MAVGAAGLERLPPIDSFGRLRVDPAYATYFSKRLARLVPAPAMAGAVGAGAYAGQTADEPGYAVQAADDPATAVARDAVETGRRIARESGTELRSDAALLLYVLSHEFVAAPVGEVQGGDLGDLRALVAGDVTRIVMRAVERGSGSPDGISAHNVVDGLSTSWDELQTASMLVWG